MFIPDTPVNKNDEENERKVRHKLYAAILERYAIIKWYPIQLSQCLFRSSTYFNSNQNSMRIFQMTHVEVHHDCSSKACSFHRHLSDGCLLLSDLFRHCGGSGKRLAAGGDSAGTLPVETVGTLRHGRKVLPDPL
jgi:hypothetical protein